MSETNTISRNSETNAQPFSSEMDFMNAFWVLWNLIGRYNTRILNDKIDLDIREFTVLSYLQQSSWTPANLASEMAIPRYEMSRVLASLEDKGAIIRTPTPSDRRSVQISSSDEGNEIWNKGVKIVQDSLKPYISEMQGDFNELTRLMRQLIERF